MARTIEFQQPNDTCLFTALQLQPVTALRFGMSTWARWLGEHIVSFPSLVRDHELGAVVIGGYIDYLRPCGFFDCDGIRVTGATRVVHKRSLLRVDYQMHAVGGPAAGAHFASGIGIVRPLYVPKAGGLGAMPIPVPPQLVERFQADEITPEESAPRPLAELTKRVADARPLAEGEHPMYCSRAQSEVADQWSFVEVGGFGALGREKLVLSAGKPELRRGLRDALRSCHIEYRKPANAFDDLSIRTRAFELDGELVFLHAVHVVGDNEVRALIAERF